MTVMIRMMPPQSYPVTGKYMMTASFIVILSSFVTTLYYTMLYYTILYYIYVCMSIVSCIFVRVYLLMPYPCYTCYIVQMYVRCVLGHCSRLVSHLLVSICICYVYVVVCVVYIKYHTASVCILYMLYYISCSE